MGSVVIVVYLRFNNKKKKGKKDNQRRKKPSRVSFCEVELFEFARAAHEAAPTPKSGTPTVTWSWHPQLIMYLWHDCMSTASPALLQMHPQPPLSSSLCPASSVLPPTCRSRSCPAPLCPALPCRAPPCLYPAPPNPTSPHALVAGGPGLGMGWAAIATAKIKITEVEPVHACWHTHL